MACNGLLPGMCRSAAGLPFSTTSMHALDFAADLDAASLSRLVELLPRFAVGAGWASRRNNRALKPSFCWAASAGESLRPTNAQHTQSGGATTAAISVIFQHLGERDDGRELAMHYTV